MIRALSPFILAAALIPISTPAATKPKPTASPVLTAQAAQVLALVKATPKLKIDKSIPSSEGFDAKTQPYVNVLGVPEGQAVGGYVDAGEAHRGNLKTGEAVIAVPLESGGSGGVFTQVLFARHANAPYAYVGYISSGGHLDVQIKDGAIVAKLPYYGANDANCCPSKIILQTYAISAGKLEQTAEKTIPTPKPSR
jgi:hypothetical protein